MTLSRNTFSYPLNDLSLDELKELQGYADYSPSQVHFWNEVHERISELHRLALADKYNITSDAFGHYTSMPELDAKRLYMTTYTQICTVQLNTMTHLLNADYGFSDDDVDYQSAIQQQLNAIHDNFQQYICDDPDEPIQDTLIRALNANSDTLQRAGLATPNNDHLDNFEGFIYGYADHGTDISDLMLANHEDN